MPITCSPGDDIDAAWSPDGARIAFSSMRDGNYEIYVMSRDGTNQTRLTDDPAADGHPGWSPDGTQIVFEAGRGAAANTTDVWIMDADGSNPRALVTLAGRDAYPSWSPDGRRIAFSHFGGSVGAGIWAVTVSDATVKQLTSGADHSPRWSPDGTQIAFDGQHGCNFDVYRLVLGTGKTVRMTRHPDGCGSYTKHPAWSPDGTSIVLWADRDTSAGPRLHLFRMKASGGALVEIIGHAVPDVYSRPHDPDWSWAT